MVDETPGLLNMILVDDDGIMVPLVSIVVLNENVGETAVSP
jgi:hypothetical protein